MPVYRITYDSYNDDDEEVTADRYQDEKTFVDFYAADADDQFTEHRVLRVKASNVKRIQVISGPGSNRA